MLSSLSSTLNSRSFLNRFVEARVEREDYKDLLLNLLAVIHRDGGQYTTLTGLTTSVVDALCMVDALHRDTAALKARLEKLLNG